MKRKFNNIKGDRRASSPLLRQQLRKALKKKSRKQTVIKLKRGA